MGRLTELFDFLNRDNVPSSADMRLHYSYIQKNPELMSLRKIYLKEKKSEALQQNLFTTSGEPCLKSNLAR